MHLQNEGNAQKLQYEVDYSMKKLQYEVNEGGVRD